MLLAIALLLAFLVLPSPWGIALVGVAAAFEVVELSIWRRTLRHRVKTGAEALVGMRAEVVEDCAPSGRARVRGELWNARSEEPLHAGEGARVRAVDGLVLQLEPEGVEAARPAGRVGA